MTVPSRWTLDRVAARARYGFAVTRNAIFSRLGIWPVDSIAGSDLASVPTFCINLARAVTKRDLMTRQVRALGLEQFEFLEAVDARTLDRDRLLNEGTLDDLSTRTHHGRVLSANEIACSLSHRAAYALILERRLELALILEDDALFLSRHARQFRLADVPPDFDCVFLNAFLREDPPIDRVRGMIHRDTSYNGSSAAYLVSAKGAATLMEATRPIIHAADGVLGRNMELPSSETHRFKRKGAVTTIRTYLCHPQPVLNGSTMRYHVTEIGTK